MKASRTPALRVASMSDAEEAAPLQRTADEIGKHGLGHLEIGNDAVAQRLHSHDLSRGASNHLAGFLAHGQYGAALGVHSHHRGLPNDHSPALHKNQYIGGSQVHPDIASKNVHIASPSSQVISLS